MIIVYPTNQPYIFTMFSGLERRIYLSVDSETECGPSYPTVRIGIPSWLVLPRASSAYRYSPPDLRQVRKFVSFLKEGPSFVAFTPNLTREEHQKYGGTVGSPSTIIHMMLKDVTSRIPNIFTPPYNISAITKAFKRRHPPAPEYTFNERALTATITNIVLLYKAAHHLEALPLVSPTLRVGHSPHYKEQTVNYFTKFCIDLLKNIATVTAPIELPPSVKVLVSELAKYKVVK